MSDFGEVSGVAPRCHISQDEDYGRPSLPSAAAPSRELDGRQQRRSGQGLSSYDGLARRVAERRLRTRGLRISEASEGSLQCEAQAIIETSCVEIFTSGVRPVAIVGAGFPRKAGCLYRSDAWLMDKPKIMRRPRRATGAEYHRYRHRTSTQCPTYKTPVSQ